MRRAYLNVIQLQELHNKMVLQKEEIEQSLKLQDPLLSEANLKIKFWEYAVHTACFTQNRSLIVKRHQKTAYEVLKKRQPEVGYFHIFGSPCFILNQRDHLGKFDEK